MKSSWHQSFSHDLGYKALALGVAIVLWVTMLGRKDISIVRNVPVQYLNEAHLIVSKGGKIAEVEVEVMGSRMSLKKFAQERQALSLDLSNLKAGTHTVRFRKDSIPVPVGSKVVSIRPEQVTLTLEPVSEENFKNDK